MSTRIIIGKIHLWLGLGSGLLVFIIALTGCLYAFQEEIQNLTQPYRHVAVEEKAFLPPSQLQDIAQKQLPDKLLHSIKYNQAGKSAEAIFYHYEPSYYYTIYMNPYTGTVLKVNDNYKGFFRFVLNGHFYLWLPPALGQPVVATATLIFVVLLLSGIVLWFPRNIKLLKQSISFVWKKNTIWKRKNYDLHKILGFYISFAALVIALTGLVWGFQWFAKTVYKGAGGKKSLEYTAPLSEMKSSKLRIASVDSVWIIMNKEYPLAKSIEVHPPETDSSVVAANANVDSGTYWKTDYRYFDQYTFKEYNVNHIYGRLKDAGFADKLYRMNYDIHVGAIGGLTGKILVFFIGLMVASLPVTGFLIWWSSKKKKEV